MRQWLVYPPAVDLANTITAGRTGVIDHLSDRAGIEEWVNAEHDRIPGVEAACRHPERVRELRDDVYALLHAAARGDRLPAHALKSVNEASHADPVYLTLDAAGDPRWRSLGRNLLDRFAGAIARSAIELAGDPHRHGLALCQASSCGMLFVRDHPRQTWCTPACGNRARVARHAARRRQGSPRQRTP
jgi:predicted RNA-binding Zn ribbon-like protein